jgi:hypothetical protein
MTALESLSRVLEAAFPGWTVTLESKHIFSATCDDYQVWVSKTVLRNHKDVLYKIIESRAASGVVREWVRHGYIVAVDHCMFRLENAVVTRVDI